MPDTTAREASGRAPYLRPRDAATLIIIDRRGAAPRVLMGRRHPGQRFMPGKFVFPGGRIEVTDRRMATFSELDPATAVALERAVTSRSTGRGRALALTAIRETFEETGLMLGRRVDDLPAAPRDVAWSAFYERGVLPDLARLSFVGRAVTPPGRPRRFDTRFFAVDRDAIAWEAENVVGPASELVELVWVDLEEARRLDLPTITAAMLGELERRVAAGFAQSLPIPFYRRGAEGMSRELLGDDEPPRPGPQP